MRFLSYQRKAGSFPASLPAKATGVLASKNLADAFTLKTLLQCGVKLAPAAIGLVVSGRCGGPGHETGEPARAGADLRGIVAGGGKPAEPRGAERSPDLALLDAVHGNAEDVGAD